MTRANIVESLRKVGLWIEKRLPAPMAAPETPRLRRMRLTLVGNLAMLALLTAAWGPIAATAARTVAALAWVALAFASLIVGLQWLVAKIRADDVWLSREGDE